jgi:hypothetical protein
MTGDGKVWDRALAVERSHGDRSEAFVPEQIASCRRDGNTEGLLLWQDVSALIREVHQIHKPLQMLRCRP